MAAIDWGVVVGRMVPYWFTVLMTGWVLLYSYVNVFEKGGALYDNMATAVRNYSEKGAGVCLNKELRPWLRLSYLCRYQRCERFEGGCCLGRQLDFSTIFSFPIRVLTFHSYCCHFQRR